MGDGQSLMELAPATMGEPLYFMEQPPSFANEAAALVDLAPSRMGDGPSLMELAPATMG